MSQLTTHILDTTKGRPAAGVTITLYHQQDNHWIEITKAFTNNDGRIPDLLPEELLLEQGIYKMHFDVASYFATNDTQAFYPFVEIVFTVDSAEHYHVPLLLNPFGYSTYRGS